MGDQPNAETVAKEAAYWSTRRKARAPRLVRRLGRWINYTANRIVWGPLLMRRAFRELATGNRVLDIGCGFGDIAADFRRRHNTPLVGIDIAAAAVAEARALGVDARNADVHDFDVNGFDRFLAWGSLYLIQDLPSVLRRIAATGGTLVAYHGFGHAAFWKRARPSPTTVRGATWTDIEPLLRDLFVVEAYYTRGWIDLIVANRNRVLKLFLAVVLKPLDGLSLRLGYPPSCALYICRPRRGPTR